MLHGVEKEIVHNCKFYIACLHINVAFFGQHSANFTKPK